MQIDFSLSKSANYFLRYSRPLEKHNALDQCLTPRWSGRNSAEEKKMKRETGWYNIENMVVLSPGVYRDRKVVAEMQSLQGKEVWWCPLVFMHINMAFPSAQHSQ